MNWIPLKYQGYIIGWYCKEILKQWERWRLMQLIKDLDSGEYCVEEEG